MNDGPTRRSRSRFLVRSVPWVLNSLLMLLFLLGQETRGLGGVPKLYLVAASLACWFIATPGVIWRAADLGVRWWLALLLWIGTTIIFPFYVLMALVLLVLPSKLQPPLAPLPWYEWLLLPILLVLPSLAVHFYKLSFVPAYLR